MGKNSVFWYSIRLSVLKAQKRLHELNLDTIIGDTLFSLRLNSLTRIYGVRNEEYFRPIWHDPHHDQPENAAYPVG